MKISDEMLSAFVNGKLEPSERQQVEQAMASDQRIARRVARQRARRLRVRGSLDDVLPQSVRQTPSPGRRLYPGPAPVIDLAQARAARAQRKPRRAAASVSRLAVLAGLTGAVVIGALLMSLVDHDGLMRYEDGRLVARGMLDTALNAQLTGQAPAGARILLTATYRAKSGDICRSFSISASQALSGLACRAHRQWRIESLSDMNGAPMAGTGQHPAIPAPLNNATETQLRAHDWQAS